MLSIASQTICMNTSFEEFKKVKKGMKHGFEFLPSNTTNTDILCGGISLGVGIASVPIAEKLTEKIMGKEDYQKAREMEKEHPIKCGLINAGIRGTISIVGAYVFSALGKKLFG